MPKFYGRNTSIHLSLADLADVTSQNPRAKQCTETSTNIIKIEHEFGRASELNTLTEEPLNGEDGRFLQFLGEHEDSPFYMVRVGKDHFSPYGTGKWTRRAPKTTRQQNTDNIALYDEDAEKDALDLNEAKDLMADRKKQCQPPINPQALCLTLYLSKASFSQIAFEKGLRRIVHKDVKIDVFLNGQFVDTHQVSYKQFSGTGSRAMRARVVRFSGHRLSRMVEKPWVFGSPDEKAGDTINDLQARDSMTPRRRWSTISNSLIAEADNFRHDLQGNRTISGQYLLNLASLSMPLELENIPNSADATFGIVDVVVVVGRGRKDGPDSVYLTKPTRLRSQQYPIKLGGGVVNANPKGHNIDAALVDLDGDGPCNATAEPKVDGVAIVVSALPAPGLKRSSEGTQGHRTPTLTEPQTKPRSEIVPLDGTSDDSSPLNNRLISELFSPARGCSPTLKRLREPHITSQSSSNPPKRSGRMVYHHIMTTKQTLSEELQQIAEQAMVDGIELKRTRGDFANESKPKEKAEGELDMGGTANDTSALISVSGSLGDAGGTEEEVSLVQTPRLSRVVKLKISPEKLESSPVVARNSTDGKAKLSNKGSRKTKTPEMVKNTTTPLAASLSDEGTTMLTASRKGASLPSPDAEVFDANFVVPELSRGCCITYAEPGVVRNVGAVRTGWFKEESVLMGTRFIVG